jgi:hypothetical protein
MTGYPISFEILTASSTDGTYEKVFSYASYWENTWFVKNNTSPTKPGTVLTPAATAIFFDKILSPILTKACPLGPINLIPYILFNCNTNG